jgi:hypothetical protein
MCGGAAGVVALPKLGHHTKKPPCSARRSTLPKKLIKPQIEALLPKTETTNTSHILNRSRGDNFVSTFEYSVTFSKGIHHKGCALKKNLFDLATGVKTCSKLS